MLDNNRRRTPGYWIQLFLAMGIATLGLVLSSTAVVIGAMLVSPLMGPILELGMGFAVGSAFLVFRAALRVAFSIILVVAGAAVLTVLLPFHEMTAEISSRAAPTALDLLVAIFCALTAVYTTVRPISETTSAAAGTAIGIALVPPLCAVGFGLGTASLPVAGGAALLFTANLSAILVFSVMSFLLLGYNQVAASQVEGDINDGDTTRTARIAARAESWLHRGFGSRHGLAVRLGIPLVFLAAVYVPLRAALNEVTWEVRARDAIRHILVDEAPRAVQTALSVERHTVSLHLVLVSGTDEVVQLEQTIRQHIRERTGVVPDVMITAVPDSRMLSAATARARGGAQEEPVDVSQLQSRTGTAVSESWPAAAAGPLVGWNLIVASRGDPTLVIYHLGPEIGPAAAALLSQSIVRRTGAAVSVMESALSPAMVAAPLGQERRFLAGADSMLAWSARAAGVFVCARGPVAGARRTTARQRDAIAHLGASDVAHSGRLVIADSGGWRLAVQRERCTAGDSSLVPVSAAVPE